MTSYGHVMVMKHARVSELKARLSGYLARVRAGDTVVVYDRNTPIARIIPYDERADRFVVHEAQQPASHLPKARGVEPRKAVDVVRMLREDRDQRLRCTSTPARFSARSAGSRSPSPPGGAGRLHTPASCSAWRLVASSTGCACRPRSTITDSPR